MNSWKEGRKEGGKREGRKERGTEGKKLANTRNIQVNILIF